MSRVFNFSAGPAALPTEVLEQVQGELLDWHGLGASVMEISHRGKAFLGIAQQAEADLRELLDIPSNYKVLFLQGGATAQFAGVPLNLTTRESTADYVNTGAWSKKAAGEAKKYCRVNVAADAAAGNTPHPTTARLATDIRRRLRALHAQRDHQRCRVPLGPRDRPVPLVADFSSTILSRPIDIARFGVIYAGAQRTWARRARGGHRSRRPAGTRPQRGAGGARLDGHGRRRIHVQHARKLLLVCRGAGLPVGQAAGRSRGDGNAEPRQVAKALCRDRRLLNVSKPDRAILPVLDERNLHA
jgi:hypothetical protein